MSGSGPEKQRDGVKRRAATRAAGATGTAGTAEATEAAGTAEATEAASATGATEAVGTAGASGTDPDPGTATAATSDDSATAAAATSGDPVAAGAATSGDPVAAVATGGDPVAAGAATSGDPVAAVATGGDRVAAAIAELYGMAPEDFTGRRTELATAAREAGDRAAAKAIGSLRRPTRTAWVVNGLSRADPDASSRLAELGSALRAAQLAGDGPRLRELSAERGALVDALTARALAAAEVADPPPSLRLEVAETITAAIADPQVAALLATGTLTRAVQWSGFGVLPPATDGAPSTDNAPDSAILGSTVPRTTGPRTTVSRPTAPEENVPAGSASPPGTRRLSAVPGPATKRDSSDRPSRDVAHGRGRSRDADSTGTAATNTARQQAEQARPHGAGAAATGATPQSAGRARSRGADGAGAPVVGPARQQAAAQRRRAEENERRARAAADRAAEEQAARRREQYAEAERAVGAASATATEAVTTEDRLEAEVRALEERLTQARDDLAAARMRARHAEAAERRARQALGRLPKE